MDWMVSKFIWIEGVHFSNHSYLQNTHLNSITALWINVSTMLSLYPKLKIQSHAIMVIHFLISEHCVSYQINNNNNPRIWITRKIPLINCLLRIFTLCSQFRIVIESCLQWLDTLVNNNFSSFIQNHHQLLLSLMRAPKWIVNHLNKNCVISSMEHDHHFASLIQTLETHFYSLTLFFGPLVVT